MLIRPKEGILDPVGQTVEGALPALGFEGVRNVHVGRLIELDVEDADQLPAMCEQLLANPLVEDFVGYGSASDFEGTGSTPGGCRPPCRTRRGGLSPG